LLDRWLGTSWLVVIGILLGAALGLYLTWKRLDDSQATTDQTPQQDR
jgi:uncharacterized protein YneF (UPF0154 family)